MDLLLMKKKWSEAVASSGRPGSNRRRSAWKADALPTELLPQESVTESESESVTESESESEKLRTTGKWRVMDSNHRRHSRQIYSLLPLATRATLRNFTINR